MKGSITNCIIFQVVLIKTGMKHTLKILTTVLYSFSAVGNSLSLKETRTPEVIISGSISNKLILQGRTVFKLNGFLSDLINIYIYI